MPASILEYRCFFVALEKSLITLFFKGHLRVTASGVYSSRSSIPHTILGLKNIHFQKICVASAL